MQSKEAQAEYIQLLKRFSLDVTSSKKPSWTKLNKVQRWFRPSCVPLEFGALASVTLDLKLC